MARNLPAGALKEPACGRRLSTAAEGGSAFRRADRSIPRNAWKGARPFVYSLRITFGPRVRIRKRAKGKKNAKKPIERSEKVMGENASSRRGAPKKQNMYTSAFKKEGAKEVIVPAES